MKALALGIAAAAVALGVGAERGETAASTVVDRTFLCSVNVHAGVRRIDVSVSPKTETPEGPPFPAGAHVSGGGSSLDSTMVSIDGGPTSGRPTGGVYVNRKRCTWLRSTRIPLSPAGLPGPPIWWSAYYKCLAPPRILVRVRGVLDRPARWVTGSRNVAIRANVLEAALAVQTSPTRKKLVFAAITRAAESKLYVAPRCEK